MWEFLVALFGGASIFTQTAVEKAGLNSAKDICDIRREEREKFFRMFTNRELEAEVVKMMRDYNRRDEVAALLTEAFASIPELKGYEKFWDTVDTKKTYSSNDHLVKLILCVQQGFLPDTDMLGFRLYKFYVIGETQPGYTVPPSITISDDSYAKFAEWITDTLRRYGSGCYLKYTPNSPYTNNFEWKVTGVD